MRSLWDDTGGHALSGVLLEGRYRVRDVRGRTVIRSQVLEKILEGLQKHGISMAAQPVRLLGEEKVSG